MVDETDRSGEIGECAVPLVSLLQGLVLGNRVTRMVQLGTCSVIQRFFSDSCFAGWERSESLFSLDINPELCAPHPALAGAGWPNELCHRRRGRFARPQQSLAAARNFSLMNRS